VLDSQITMKNFKTSIIRSSQLLKQKVGKSVVATDDEYDMLQRSTEKLLKVSTDMGKHFEQMMDHFQQLR
jgi:hypothetical protein